MNEIATATNNLSVDTETLQTVGLVAVGVVAVVGITWAAVAIFRHFTNKPAEDVPAAATTTSGN